MKAHFINNQFGGEVIEDVQQDYIKFLRNEKHVLPWTTWGKQAHNYPPYES